MSIFQHLKLKFALEIPPSNKYYQGLIRHIKNINVHPLELVPRHRDPQLQVGENDLYLFNLRLNICKA